MLAIDKVKKAVLALVEKGKEVTSEKVAKKAKVCKETARTSLKKLEAMKFIKKVK